MRSKDRRDKEKVIQRIKHDVDISPTACDALETFLLKRLMMTDWGLGSGDINETQAGLPSHGEQLRFGPEYARGADGPIAYPFRCSISRSPTVAMPQDIPDMVWMALIILDW
jgi:hypothetical protein